MVNRLKTKPKTKSKPQATTLWLFAGVALLVVGVGGVVKEWGHKVQTMLPMIATESIDATTPRYTEAVKAQNSGDDAKAETLFESCLSAPAGLRNIALIRLATIEAKLGKEGEAQAHWQRLRQNAHGSALALLADYELGRSYLRANEPDAAEKQFESVVAQVLHSGAIKSEENAEAEVGYGAYYYLGELAASKKQFDVAATDWRRYLLAQPAGTFSGLVAKGLFALPGAKTPQDYALAGQAYFENENYTKAVEAFKQANLADVYYPLGKAYFKLGKRDAAVSTWMNGLKYSKNQDMAEKAIKSLLSLQPNTLAKVALLKSLLAQKIPASADFVLWNLAALSPASQAQTFQTQLLQSYPQSNWAPETSWQLAWQTLLKGNRQAFFNQAEAHLKRYPNSLSAPKMLFWKAKLLAASGQGDNVKTVLHQLADRYSNTYYAFRAEQLLTGETHPWQTNPQAQLAPLDLESLSSDVTAGMSSDLKEVTQAMIAVNDGTGLALVLPALNADDRANRVPLQSIAFALQQQYPQSMRTVRDYFDQIRLSHEGAASQGLWHLFYPAVFINEANEAAREQGLDPYLVLALTRQESYFNPLAVSSSYALGLMQLLPATAKDVAKWERMAGFNTAQLFEPEVNIRLGTRYLAYLHQKFNGNSMLSVGGYNGGPNAMARWASAKQAMLAHDPDMFIETIPYDQTRDYIKEVFTHYWIYQKLLR